MSTQAEQVKDLINNLNMGTAKSKAGDFLVEGATRKGAAVADSEEATSPTVAEFNALLASLRAAGLIAT